MAVIYAGAAPTVEATVLSQTGTTVILYSKTHHDVETLASLASLDLNECREIVGRLQSREALVRLPEAEAFIIRALDVPIKKMTQPAWHQQQEKVEQRWTRRMYDKSLFSLAPNFQEQNQKNVEWQPREICRKVCLVERSQCIPTADIALKRVDLVKVATRNHWISELKSFDPEGIELVYRQLLTEATKDEGSSLVELPCQAFCTGVYFLKKNIERLDFDGAELNRICQELSRLANVAYANEIKALMAQAQKEQVPLPKKTPVLTEEKGDKTPLNSMTQFIRGNIKKFGFVVRSEAEAFYNEMKLGKKGQFSKIFREALNGISENLGCRITRVGVPSLAGGKHNHIFARETDPNRQGSWERAVHRYLITVIGRELEKMGELNYQSRHKTKEEVHNDLYIKSAQTGKTGHIEIKTGGKLRRKSLPQTKESILIITP